MSTPRSDRLRVPARLLVVSLRPRRPPARARARPERAARLSAYNPAKRSGPAVAVRRQPAPTLFASAGYEVWFCACVVGFTTRDRLPTTAWAVALAELVV